jgi:HSP20 family protein
MARRGGAPSLLALSPSDVSGLSPFELIRSFTDELDRIFGGLALTRGFGPGEIEAWAPAVDIFERGNNLVVRAEVPGTEPGDIRVEVTDDGLVIAGERRREREEPGEGGYRREIVYGRFYRLIPLPEGINTDQVQARINNGVLEIEMPMAEVRRPRRSIPVETGAGREARAGEQARAVGEQAQTATGGSGRR